VTERSLRARLITGVVVWTIGILGIAGLVAFTLSTRYPRWGLFLHHSLLALGGATLVTAGVAVIRRWLLPFEMLRERLSAVRDGRSARLEGGYPSEVAPLVEDLNALLQERERRVARAVARAGDLAHGLRTPLAILAQEVERADAAGQHDLAASIRQQVVQMRRQIDSHLAQARVTAAGLAPIARANVGEAVGGLIRTMERLYAERALAFVVNVPAEYVVRVPLEDLEEMAGNLLDNACKWARSRVAVSAAVTGAQMMIAVDDDGGGLDPAMRTQVLQRGVRADEAAPGFGLGLAIVRNLAEAYGGSVSLQPSSEGGVRAELTLPASR
jgi:signal transduction histidine kinase